MNKFKTKKIVSIVALVLCLALVATFVLAFTACDEENASAKSLVSSESGFVYGWSSTIDENGRKVFDEPPETTDSEIIETVYIENDAVTNVSEPDENGVSTCIYEGESAYLSPGGGIYTIIYPYSYTLAPISSPSKGPEIQVSLIFRNKPTVYDGYFNDFHSLYYIEVGSLTGEPLDVVTVSYKTEAIYEETIEFDENDGAHVTGFVVTLDEDARTYVSSEAVPSTMTKTYHITLCDYGYTVIRIELGNGDEYFYGVEIVGDKIMYEVIMKDDVEETGEDIETDY